MILVALPVIFAVITLVFGVIDVLVDYVRILRLRQRMAPGPLPLPLFGNIFHIPSSRQWKKFEEWSLKHQSSIITIWDGHTPVVICNDAWSMSDLCDKRANVFSSRPVKTLTGKIFGLNKFNQAGLAYGEQWRVHRRLTHSAANAQVVQAYRPSQANEAKLLIEDCLTKPDRFVDSALRFTVSIVSVIAWGRRIGTESDTVLKVAQAYVGSANLGFPGKTYTEAIPALADMPSWLNPLPNQLRKLAQTSNKYFYALSDEGSNAAQDNFAKRLLKEKEEHGLSKVEISNLTGNFIGAGVDTTTSTMLTFVLAMCLNQEVQSKAHEEIDRIIGRDRYPEWSDEDSLPYLAAVINETLRWRPAFALGGPPHAPIEDDIYNGFFFPRGTSIIGNLYAMHRNPREFPEPHRFWPERFMEGFDGPAYPNKRGHNTFGWGRRVCSGEALAQQSLYFTIVSLLWAFEIRPGLDEKGNEVALDPDAYTVSQVNRPLPFKVRFLPRSGTIADLVRSGAQEARTQLQAYDAATNVTFESAQSVSLDMPIAQAKNGSAV
ncbi:cytochrome P450 [Colletotrichum godetiae]|uniref:Cytochrome P450 n=1 Tax=Colletotrichum godetiae TaxID=1209918 RepID=A0AAJ0AUD4_9PEZI|nr:cytochrome P450 [Colletotrichum godetiae]KAK1690546.1 cytochrome P450 [Colletotrichum godetiae]